MKYLCDTDAIEDDGSRAFELEKNSLFLVKKRGEFFAYLNQCPHLGIRLEWVEHRFLDNESSLIQCSTHGALFTIEKGFCVSGPCSGQSLIKVALDVRDGQIFVDL